MNRNHTSKSASRKSFLSFGVLSPQQKREQQTLTTQPRLEQKVQPQPVPTYKRPKFLRRTQ